MKKIVLIIGPSGSGKTTLMKKTFGDNNILRSVTSRAKRPGETNGQGYIFLDKKSFLKLLDTHKLVQQSEYNGNYYGVTTDEIDNKLSRNDTVSVAIVYQSIPQYLKYAQNHKDVSVIPFFTSISKDTLLKHFDLRTESKIEKDKRISLYENEIKNKQFFSKNRILNMDVNDFGESAKNKILAELCKLDLDNSRIEENEPQDKLISF